MTDILKVKTYWYHQKMFISYFILRENTILMTTLWKSIENPRKKGRAVSDTMLLAGQMSEKPAPLLLLRITTFKQKRSYLEC